jgi:asparagine synthetase B (glutamine-hydrolysing)
MCGIFGCICRKGSKGCVGLKKLKPLQVDQIRRRGPDAVSSVDMEVGGCSVSLCGTVLHMRGQLTKQPVVSEGGNALLWNGEVYGGLKLRDDENDTTTVLEALDKCSSDEEVLAILSSIRGPWAMVYMQYSTGRMWFGRDVFGRRSLLWHLPSEVEDFFAVTSVAAKDSLDWEHSVGDADKDQLWKEIPAVGVFYVDLKKLFSEGVVSSLWCCPWIQGEQPYQEDVECSIDHIHTSMKLRVVERSNLFVNFPPLNKTIPSCDRKESHVTGSQETVVIHDEIFPSRSIGTSVDTKLCVKESDKQLDQSVKSHGGKQKQKTCILQPQDGVQEYDPVVKPVNAQQQVVAEKHPESNQQQQQCGMGAKLRSSQQQLGMGTNLGTKHEQPDIKNVGDHSVGSRDAEKDDLKPFHGSALSRGQQTLPSDLAAYFLDLLRQSVLRRVHNLPVVAKAEVKDGCLATGARLGILFSGGVDSVVMAALADLYVAHGPPQ